MGYLKALEAEEKRFALSGSSLSMSQLLNVTKKCGSHMAVMGIEERRA